ncbi:capsule assembly Wzi family protein [Pedobacter duraquae]|uniref:Capsule assembly protein Wzi n=1 Tax=Pedobacter duraquae TaxID=425511 RepID=A0A4R6IJ28_9SPHI|nr:capsule assembly Wzi family protein [Pedobacter duraquae]TDO21983.1 capsule assembly protein Wzi [Pedobacter duraquae]
MMRFLCSNVFERVKIVFTGVIFLFTCYNAKAQTLPTTERVLKDYYRRSQLLGSQDSSISFGVQPLFGEALGVSNIFFPVNSEEFKPSESFRFSKGKGLFMLLPLEWQQQFNSHHPYGWNDGAFIPSKGYQTVVGAGFFAKYGPLTIQVRPEYVYASNSQFESYGEDRSDYELSNYYIGNYNYIDAPERFGETKYKKLLWGQSSIRLTQGPLSLGLSNENLWWGPGRKNSILMTDNAPGFKHLTLNSVRPLKTPIGSFEGQLIAGRLEESGYAPIERQTTSTGQFVRTIPRHDWRYLSGLNITYQPKWIPGLFLGYNRDFMSYGPDLKSFNDYFPYFTPFQKAKFNDGQGDDLSPRDQRTSFNARWVFPKAKAEVYFEYGLNDNSFNFRDFIGSPQHSRAYLFGMSKLVPLPSSGEFLEISAEVTQLSQPLDGRLIRDANGFYYHATVTQGYTNLGQVLGAGIGSGGNLQTLSVSWVRNLKQIGLTVDRYEHNLELYTSAIRGLNGFSRSWVDIAFAVFGTWEYKNLLLNTKMQGIRSLNYQWRMKDYIPDQYYIPNNDIFNFHGELGVAYRF